MMWHVAVRRPRPLPLRGSTKAMTSTIVVKKSLHRQSREGKDHILKPF